MWRVAIAGIDLIAIGVLCFGLYFPRNRRRDMVLAYLGLNVGVMAVAVGLSNNTSIGTGFGLGLFGALSIIRLRSEELPHADVAYYFAALALGLLGGIEITPRWMSVVLPVAIIVVVYVGDHPRLFGGYRQQTLVLDRAIADEGQLVAELKRVLGADVHHYTTKRLDLVNDSMVVDVRYRIPKEQRPVLAKT
jgi:Domain of unknown function (DUF4956)